MKTLKEIGIDNVITSQWGWNESSHDVFDSMAVSDEVVLTNGKTFAWEYVEPIMLIQKSLDASPELQNRYASTFRQHPGTREQPWSIVIGFDELVPGDKLSGITSKKIMCLYFNFMTLGTHTISQGSTWFAPCVIRSETLHLMHGGWSSALRCILRRMFLGPQGLATAGAPLRINGRPYILFANLGVLISDGDGHRLACSWNGASSVKPCVRHHNVLMKNSDLCGRVDGYVEITCSDPSQFRYSPAKLSESVDLVAAAHRRWMAGGCTKAFYKRIVKERGFQFTEGGIVFDVELRTRLNLWDAIRLDWVHSALQDGCLSIECHLFINACEPLGLDYTSVEEFFKLGWFFPKSMQSKGQSLHRVFSSWRCHEEANKLKASASECLGVYTILRQFALSEVGDMPEVAPQRASFDAMCDAVDTIQLAKKSLIALPQAADRLNGQLTKWLDLHTAAYGEDRVKPKFHWMFDVAEHMSRDDILMDQFIVERLHLLVKHHAERCDNPTKRYERAVLSGVLHSQLTNVARLRRDCSMIDKTTMTLSGFPDARFGDNMEIYGMQISVSDFVFHSESLGEVVACAEEHGSLIVIVTKLRIVDRSSDWSSRWRRTKEMDVWPAQDVCQDIVFLISGGMVLHVGCLRHARLCRSVAFRMRPQSSHPIPQLVARARAHNKRFSRHWRGMSSTTILTLCCARSVLDRLDWAARMESKGLHASAWRLQMHLQIALQAHVLCKAHGADHSYARKAHGAHNSYARKAHGAHKCYTRKARGAQNSNACTSHGDHNFYAELSANVRGQDVSAPGACMKMQRII